MDAPEKAQVTVNTSTPTGESSSVTSSGHEQNARDKNKTAAGRSERHLKSGCELVAGNLLADRYLLVKSLGTGGSCYVFLARDLAAIDRKAARKTQVVLKVLRPEWVDKLGGAGLIFEEALVTRYLTHTNIIKVFDYHQCHFSGRDWHFLTMEYIEGETLADLLARAPENHLSLPQALNILAPIAEALDEAHKNGIVHADVKPANIMIDWQGVPKLIDFGTARGCRQAIARQWDSQGSLAPELQNLYEDNKPYYGFTKAYASRALMADLPVSAQDDVYSFACLIYEILGGRTAHNTALMWEDVVPSENENFMDTRRRASWLKPETMTKAQWRVLKRVLEQRAVQLYPTTRKFLDAFIKARDFKRNMALSGIAGVVCLGLLYSGAVACVGFIRQMETWQHSDGLLVVADDLTRQLQEAPVEELAPTLREVGQLPPLLRAGVIATTEVTLVEKTQSWVQVLVYLSSEIEQLSDMPADDNRGDFATVSTGASSFFSEIDDLLRELNRLLPKNQEVTEIDQRVRAARQQQANTIKDSWRAVWEDTDFSQTELARLAQLSATLQQADRAWVPEVPPKAKENYQRQLAQAIEEKNGHLLERLKGFEVVWSTGSVYQFFSNAWQHSGAEQVLMPLPESDQSLEPDVNPVALSQIPAGQSEALETDEPMVVASADTVAPSVAWEALKNEMSTVWLDKALMAAPGRVQALLVNEGLAAEDALAQELMQILANRFALKIKYYHDTDRYVSTVRLERELERLNEQLRR